MIDEEQIRAVATDAAYKRGVRYFRRGAVGHLERQEDGRSYTAVVEGTEAYHVRISLTGAGDEVESFHCDCPAAAQYLGEMAKLRILKKLYLPMQLVQL